MGHDIYVYKFKKPVKEITYLRRGAFNPTRHDIYKIMKYEFADNGCSGDGSSWIIDYEDVVDELPKWIKRATKLNQKDLIIFFKKIKKELEKQGQVLISFN